MTEEERKAKEAARLKDKRLLIVMNLLNGVPEWQLAQTFQIDVKDVQAVFRQAMNKVKNYLFKLCKPPIACDTIGDARRNRVNIMAILPKLNLDVQATYGKIVEETVTGQNYGEALNDLRAR